MNQDQYLCRCLLEQAYWAWQSTFSNNVAFINITINIMSTRLPMFSEILHRCILQSNFSSIITCFSFILATCKNNITAVEQCGEMNSCEGTFDNFICVCDSFGYKQSGDNQFCIERKFLITVFSKHFEWCCMTVVIIWFHINVILSYEVTRYSPSLPCFGLFS